jgi:undecaprenyl-diphosphatase
MGWIQAIILGVIQGLTEFLPISSSGHLVLAQHLIGVEAQGILLEVTLHMGTMFAILIYYYDEIKQLIQSAIINHGNSRMYIIYLVVATIPAVFAGLLLKNSIETTYTVSVVKYMLIITGLIVGSTYFFQNKVEKEIVVKTAFYIGIAQVFALLPGISRSGMAISIAIILGIQNDKAAKFAFFMAIPVLLGAGLMQLFSIDLQSSLSFMPLLIGFISSAVTGYLVINWLLSVISKGKFYLFSLYCFMVSIILFILIN